MKSILGLVLLLLVPGLLFAQQTPWSLGDLRLQLEHARNDSLQAEQFLTMGEHALAVARQASSRGSFWNAISFVSELCEVAPHLTARTLRIRALELLVHRFTDAMRWSSLVTERFIPRFDHIDRQEWSSELAEYDRLLDRLGQESDNDRVRAEFLYAKSRVRMHIDRRWDWLTEGARMETMALLDSLIDRFGDFPCPGDDSRSIRDRARPHYRELQTLHFGAVAPTTSGTDLYGEPLEIESYRGKVVVLDFWTTFCQPCLAMVPHTKALLKKFDGHPVVYIGVNGDTERSKGLKTAQRYKMTWRNLWDGPDGPYGPASTAWNVAARGWPAVFVLDDKGRIRYKFTGKDQAEEELESAISLLLAELER